MRKSSISISEFFSNLKSTIKTSKIEKYNDFVVMYCVYEFCLIFFGGYYSNFSYSHWMLHWTPEWRDTALMAFLLSCTTIGGSLVRSEYHACATLSQTSVVWRGIASASRGFALLLLILFVLRPSEDVSRGGVLTQFAFVACMVAVSRGVFNAWVRQGLSSGRLYLNRAMILSDKGRSAPAVDEMRFLRHLRRDGVEVARVRALRTAASDEAEQGVLETIISDCRTDAIDTVIIIPTDHTIAYAERVVSALSETPVTVHVLPFGSVLGTTSASTSIGGQPSIVIAHSPVDNFSKILKRALDILAAAVLLVMLAPLFLMIACLIKLETPGPVFFRQTRHGYGNRHFKVFKFRSMRVMEEGAAFRQAVRNDSRVTGVGRLMRRTSIDELPQLINVMLGQMSLVGPRPHPVALNECFAPRIRLFHRRHNIAPGMTGWAQVNGFRGETDTDAKMQARIEHDLWYIDHWSLALDCRILFLTVFSSLTYRNAG